MSEPSSKLDMNSLSEALEVGATDEITTKEKDAEERARELMNKSNTLTTSTSSTTKSGDKDSPQTLSPPGSPAEHGAQSEGVHAAPAATLDPTTQQIKSMFPNLEVDTIQAVVVAEDGDFERAINTLLQMSDPSYVPPPPFRRTSQTDRDEQLARSLAEAEQEGAQGQFVAPSGRAAGGGLGSLFGLTGQSQQSQRPPQNYDATNLAYQPRVRRTPSGQTQPQRAAYTDDASHAQQSGNSATGFVPPGLPGPREAKQWQEDINKLAETGFAKAASTFSALRQRGEQAWASRAQNASPSNTNADANGQRGGSIFAGWNQRNHNGSGSQSVVSPTIGSDRGFDRDPSPVGDNELANILARGRSEEGQRGTGKASISDRYKQVISDQRVNMKARRSGSRHEQEDDDDDGDAALGWDDAGRTSAKGKGPATESAAAFQPIKIADNSEPSTPIADAKTGQRTTVSLLDNSGEKKHLTQQTGHQDDDDDDDLEYVANPFEDDD